MDDSFSKAVPATEEPPRRRPLEPGPGARALMWFCIGVQVPAILLPQVVPLWVAAITWLSIAMGTVAILVYRWSRRRAQREINRLAQTLAAEDFLLYLRPFVTSGRLPVPCQLPVMADRWIMGRDWDLELALSLAVPRGELVALGDVEGAFGAAKLEVRDETWKSTVLDLAARASLIVMVPLARPATLWEVRQVFANPELLQKTVFIMPPTGLVPSLYRLLRPWRRSTRWLWQRARRSLAREGIDLPPYSRKGAILVHDGSQLAVIRPKQFRPKFLREMLLALARSIQDGRRSAIVSELYELSSAYSNRRALIDYVVFVSPPAVILGLLVAVFFRSVLFQPFVLPSGSLVPTLLVGDYFFVSKYAYGYSRYSLPLSLPLFEGRVWGTEPKRGDIAVFKLPRDDSTAFVKRVIGLPGDRIQVLGGVLHINGQTVPRERVGEYRARDSFGRTRSVPMYKETLPNGVAHHVVEADEDRGYWDNTKVYTVPAGHFFMMGDNRDNSTDSRDERSVGPVPFENFVGRAEIIFFSLEENASPWKVWTWPWTVRWSRILQPIDP